MPLSGVGQLTVEKTPSYFMTPGAAQRVYNMSRDVRLLVVVRDPVTRALSHFTQAQSATRRRRRRADPRSFERRAFLDAQAQSTPRHRGHGHGHGHVDPRSFERRAFLDAARTAVDTSWPAISVGLYARHAASWLRQFPRSHVHFVHGDRLVTDPAAQLADVQAFLGLRPLVTRQHFHFNATKGFPCVRTSARSRPRCLGDTKGRVHPHVDADVLSRLRDFYRPHNEQFYAMTGVDFGWN